MARYYVISAVSTLVAMAVACEVQTMTPGTADKDTTETERVDAGRNKITPTSEDAGDVSLSFVPSNVTGTVENRSEGITIRGTCSFDTDQGTVSCASDEYIFQTVTQTDENQTKIGVFTTGSLTIGPDAVVDIVGSKPAVIVTPGPILIQGTLQATPKSYDMDTGRGGGFSGPSTYSTSLRGKGPGYGGVPVADAGGGGAAYCGKGGGPNGGSPYGNPELSPLLGGSSGALCGENSQAGAGGGAIQLVSGDSITLTSLAIIQVGGGGGTWGGGGGGSGGAILLEAPTVSVSGILAANGGGGGDAASGSGAAGVGSATAALGGRDSSSSNAGGDGSADATIDGHAGGQDTSLKGIDRCDFGGGGGGAGRIRINTSTGVAAITGTLSPASSTTCVSQGKLKPR